MKKTYKLDVDCPVCAQKIEREVAKLEGIESACVSYMSQKIDITFKEGASVESVIRELKKRVKRVERSAEVYA